MNILYEFENLSQCSENNLWKINRIGIGKLNIGPPISLLFGVSSTLGFGTLAILFGITGFGYLRNTNGLGFYVHIM